MCIPFIDGGKAVVCVRACLSDGYMVVVVFLFLKTNKQTFLVLIQYSLNNTSSILSHSIVVLVIPTVVLFFHLLIAPRQMAQTSRAIVCWCTAME